MSSNKDKFATSHRFVFQVGRFVPVWLHCLAFQVSRICFAQKMTDAKKGGYAKAKEVRSPAASSTASRVRG